MAFIICICIGVAFSGCNVPLSVSLLALAVGANGAIYSGEQSAMMGEFKEYMYFFYLP